MRMLWRGYGFEHGGDTENLALYGQDNNGGVWAICKMNMILHGIRSADIQNEDVIAEPLHLEDGEPMRFDRVISNPPFSQNYSQDGLKFRERFRYGLAPETGKKADLMFAQHMLASLRKEGMMATVMPHGVLFRGGAEGEIRKGFVESDALEAVIGLAPNLFYGTGIPACILVMRPPGSKSPERRGKVLFINADREFHAGRAQNFLRPEHVEKIVSTFERFEDVPGFAKVVDRARLEAEGFNCNIRRYADNTPPSEPHDVRAHLLGGVPKAEVEAKKALFEAHGFDPHGTVFVERDAGYLDFAPALKGRSDIKAVVEEDAGLYAREEELRDAFATWWEEHEPRLAALPETKDLTTARAELLASFADALKGRGPLDRFEVDGVIARWWNETKPDLATIATRGFEALVEGWATTVRDGLEQNENGATGERFDPLSDRLVAYLIPDYRRDIEAAEADLAEAQGRLDAATATATDDEDEEAQEAEPVSDAELKALKKNATVAKSRIKRLRDSLADRLEAARAGLTAEDSRRLALDIARDDLAAELERYVAAHRHQIVAAIGNWWDKYRVSIGEIEAGRNAAARRLAGTVEELGYLRVEEPVYVR